MKRELNPNLFTSEPSTSSVSSPNVYDQVNTSANFQTNNSSYPAADYADLQIIAAQLDGLKQNLKQVVNKVQKQDSIIDELVGGTQLKFDKFKSAFHRVEDYVKNNVSEVRGQFGKLNSKLVSQNLSETKIEQMIERQNQMVANFEAKLGQMQKIMSEQQMQLLNYKTALQEARQEIARLKRM